MKQKNIVTLMFLSLMIFSQIGCASTGKKSIDYTICESDKIKRAILKKWWIDPQITEGIDVDFDQLDALNEGTVYIKKHSIPFKYSDGTLIFTESDSDKTIKVKVIVNEIKTINEDFKSNKCNCNAKVSVNYNDGYKDETIVYSIYFQPQIKRDSKYSIDFCRVITN